MKLRIQWLIRNIIRIALPMLSPVIILGVLSFGVIQGELNTEIREKNMQLMQQTNQAIELVFGTIEQIAALFDSNSNNQYLLKSVLNKPSSMPLNKEDFDTVLFLSNMIRSYQHPNPYIHSVYIYTRNQYGNVISSRSVIANDQHTREAAWIDALEEMQADQMHVICERNLEEYPYESGTVDCITISRQIQSLTSKSVGIITVNYRRNMIEDLLEKQISIPGSAIFLVESKEVIASANNIDGFGEDAISADELPSSSVSKWVHNGKRYICFSDTSKIYGFDLISVVSENRFYQTSRNILSITIVLLFVSFIIGILISYYIAHKDYISLSNILAIIKAAENDEPLPIQLSNPKDEYEYLLQNIISVFIKKSIRRTRIAENKYALTNLELMILQEQINPHFLFNTLRTIFWKTVGLTKSPNEASRMIEYLTDLLSFVFSVPGYRVTLKQEINYINSYVNIQRIRYNDKFNFMWHYDTELENAMIMKLLLQPIIENSIIHGVAKGDKERYIIRVSIVRQDDLLVIRITDNGPGMSSEELKKVRADLDQARDYGKHIGLKNVKKRLEVFYNKEKVHFSIYSKLHIGTSVKIAFPYEENEDKEKMGLWGQ